MLPPSTSASFGLIAAVIVAATGAAAMPLSASGPPASPSKVVSSTSTQDLAHRPPPIRIAGDSLPRPQSSPTRPGINTSSAPSADSPSDFMMTMERRRQSGRGGDRGDRGDSRHGSPHHSSDRHHYDVGHGRGRHGKGRKNKGLHSKDKVPAAAPPPASDPAPVEAPAPELEPVDVAQPPAEDEPAPEEPAEEESVGSAPVAKRRHGWDYDDVFVDDRRHGHGHDHDHEHYHGHHHGHHRRSEVTDQKRAPHDVFDEDGHGHEHEHLHSHDHGHDDWYDDRHGHRGHRHHGHHRRSEVTEEKRDPHTVVVDDAGDGHDHGHSHIHIHSHEHDHDDIHYDGHRGHRGHHGYTHHVIYTGARHHRRDEAAEPQEKRDPHHEVYIDDGDDHDHSHAHERFHGHRHGHHHKRSEVVEEKREPRHETVYVEDHGRFDGYRHGHHGDIWYDDEGHDHSDSHGHGHEHKHKRSPSHDKTVIIEEGHRFHHHHPTVVYEDGDGHDHDHDHSHSHNHKRSPSHDSTVIVEDGYRHHHRPTVVYEDGDDYDHSHGHSHGHQHSHGHHHKRDINLLRPHYGSSPGGDINVLSPILSPLPPLPPQTAAPAAPVSSHKRPILNSGPPNFVPAYPSPNPNSAPVRAHANASPAAPLRYNTGAGNLNILSPEYHAFQANPPPAARPRWSPRGGRSMPLPFFLKARQEPQGSKDDGGAAKEGGQDGDGSPAEDPSSSDGAGSLLGGNGDAKTIGTGRGSFRHHVNPSSSSATTPDADTSSDVPETDASSDPTRRSNQASAKSDGEELKTGESDHKEKEEDRARNKDEVHKFGHRKRGDDALEMMRVDQGKYDGPEEAY